MRHKILSTMIALFVVLMVLGMSHFIKNDMSGMAVAAPRLDIENHRAGHQSDLRKEVVYRPGAFLELAGRDVRSLLKAPDLVRQESPVVVWQYRTESCVLDLYFSSKNEDVSAAKVVHYEMRARHVAGQSDEFGVADPVCVRHLVRARNGIRMVDVSAIFKNP